MNLPGQVDEVLVVGPEEFLADFLSQIAKPFFQQSFEFQQLSIVKHDVTRLYLMTP
jgi:hypothetical protein